MAGRSFSFLCTMSVAYALFVITLIVLLYTYAGYGLLLLIIKSFKKKSEIFSTSDDLPAVTLIIPAFNEEDWLEQKIKNSFLLKYPKEKLFIVFVIDGSTDNSKIIIDQYPNISALYQPERKGKMAAINRCMQSVTTPIVVFSDANTLLNDDCLLHLVKHYQMPKVGGVAGEKKIYTPQKGSSIGYSEGLYWKYESFLKQLDSDFNTVVGAAGELFSMRTSLFAPQDEQIILDDFILSMKICIDGYKVIYEPKAFAIETPSINIAEERKRRVRIAAGAFQTIALLWKYKLFFKKPLLYFQYFSRRILRWVACPLCLVLLYLSNAYLVLQTESSPVFTLFFILQNLFYGIALAGGFWYKAGVSLNIYFIPFYFVFMNSLLFEGFIKFISGKQSVLWEKSKRKLILMQAEDK